MGIMITGIMATTVGAMAVGTEVPTAGTIATDNSGRVEGYGTKSPP
jgi:hypothetical protein